MFRKIFISLLLIPLFHTASADEGMWLPGLISSRIDDMRSKGFMLSAEDLYSIDQASIKDAIVRFGSGCTGELISADGLLLTNHHCGFPQIQDHSSVENDYLKDGFWAMSRGEELPNPGLVVTFLVRMEDVTGQVLRGCEGLDNEQAAAVRRRNIKEITDRATEGTHYTASVESMYYGNQYFLFVNEVFKDVRLVAAPPSSIGSFGGDTDNWMWPRHTGDFSLFRIYADAENRPAEYSPENVPYTPKKYFAVSTAGIEDDQFTMVYGFPANTTQYLYSAAVEQIIKDINPMRIELRTERLDIIKQAQSADPSIRIAYADKAALIANAWKKWQGESLGLLRLGTVQKKRQYEDRFAVWAEKTQYNGLMDRFAGLYDRMERYTFMVQLYQETFLAIELNSIAGKLILLPHIDNSVDRAEFLAREFYKDYSVDIDRRITAYLLEQLIERSSPEMAPRYLEQKAGEHGTISAYVEWLYDNTVLRSMDAVMEVHERYGYLPGEDPYLELYGAMQEYFRDVIYAPSRDMKDELDDLYHIYMKGMMEYEPGRDFFPDANRTLRISYGHVAPYSPEDGVTHLSSTTVRGIVEKDDPAEYDYDIPQSLREVIASGDYGRWVSNGTMPVNFIATNHTTGGNSGSPVLNGDGRLIGINFDRTWMSTMSDIEFDPYICRNIVVDIRYVLMIIDKIGGAQHLLDEMTIY